MHKSSCSDCLVEERWTAKSVKYLVTQKGYAAMTPGEKGPARMAGDFFCLSALPKMAAFEQLVLGTATPGLLSRGRPESGT